MAAVQICGDSEQTVKVFCKVENSTKKLALGITGDKARFVDYDCADETQTWLKIQSGDIAVGGFVLVNKKTNKAISQPLVGPVVDQEVVLVDYVAGSFANLSLWSESEKVYENEYRCICAAKNTTLSLEVDVNTHGIKIVLKVGPLTPPPAKQLWNISPQIATVSCKAYPNQALALKNNGLKFVSPASSDATQQWVKILTTNHQAFALVNKAAWIALENPSAAGREVVLVAYENILKQNLLWSESGAKIDGYETITISNDKNLNLDADNSSQDIKVVVQTSNELKISQLWKISPCT